VGTKASPDFQAKADLAAIYRLVDEDPYGARIWLLPA